MQTLEADLQRSRNDSGLGGYAWPDENRNPFVGQMHNTSLPMSRTGSIDTGRTNEQSSSGGLRDKKTRTEVHMSEDIHKAEEDTPCHVSHAYKRASQNGSAMPLASIPENGSTNQHGQECFGQDQDAVLAIDNGL